MNPDLMQEIAAAAAALVVDEGLEYGSAKRRALKQLGLPPRTPLPDNLAVEAAVREHLAIFHADTQPAELQALRELALVWMERLAEFQPHLGGAVWHGTATELSDIYLQLFSDDPKAVELALINRGVDYEARSVNGLHGHEVEALSLRSRCEPLQTWVGVHLLVNDGGDFRGALLRDAAGRKPRGDARALRERMAQEASVP
ncbi:hypothetical protein [Malikia spinosa]|jgi:hypothetical protein|uniref:UDP-N-acetylmuramate--alanine ligase n=1 Tax=Malikia spinosa TaxID=86180 RepID=A0A7C9MRH6_9BURK|nr:hypothetical protein [Malikia spinosa]MYZ51858.1 hypothetical protein [Malikia spinosa]OGB70660.1 MAG: hypothetical protein A2486_00305 [Burkholderiales bacterium RIFOXYC12_FULL_65_23]